MSPSFWTILGYKTDMTTANEDLIKKEEFDQAVSGTTVFTDKEFSQLWEISPLLCEHKFLSSYLNDPLREKDHFFGFVIWMMNNHSDEFSQFMIRKGYVPSLDVYTDLNKRKYFEKHTWDLLFVLLENASEKEESFLIHFIANSVMHDYRSFRKGDYHRLSRMLLLSLFSENNTLNKRKHLTRKIMDILRSPGYPFSNKNGKDLHLFRKEILSPIRKYLLLSEMN